MLASRDLIQFQKKTAQTRSKQIRFKAANLHHLCRSGRKYFLFRLHFVVCAANALRIIRILAVDNAHIHRSHLIRAVTALFRLDHFYELHVIAAGRAGNDKYLFTRLICKTLFLGHLIYPPGNQVRHYLSAIIFFAVSYQSNPGIDFVKQDYDFIEKYRPFLELKPPLSLVVPVQFISKVNTGHITPRPKLADSVFMGSN